MENTIEAIRFRGRSLKIPPRIDKMRRFILSIKPEICVERMRYYTESFKQTEHLPTNIRRALAFDNCLNKMKIYILDDELIVGNQASRPRAAPIFPEFDVQWLENEFSGVPFKPSDRPGDRFYYLPETEKEFFALSEYWRGKTHAERCVATMPEPVFQAWKMGVIDNYWVMVGGDGHIIPDYPKILNKGLAGIIKEAEEHLARLDLTNPEHLVRVNFLKAVVIYLKAVIKFSKRFAELARAMAAKEKDKGRSWELMKIAEVCERVPENPARSFWEAIQSIYFIHLTLQIDNNGHSMSLGRFDQYLYPFYEKSIKSGELTREQALELLGCLWLKLFSINKLRPWECTQFFRGYPMFQNLTIGGQKADGSDATNELTYLVLECQAIMRLPAPSISIRVHDKTPDELAYAALDVNMLGGGQPAWFSDEVMIPSLMNRSIPWEDACDYAIVGCVEAIVPGKGGYRPNGACFVNLLKILELTLNGGLDPRTGYRLCPDERNLANFRDFEDLMDAFRKQIRFYIDQHIIADAVADISMDEVVPDSYISALVQDCVNRGKPIKRGGSIYDHVGDLLIGTANTVNSLAAIKKIVFDEKKCSGEQLLYALKTNWKQTEKEPNGAEVRRWCIDSPKFGNDDDYVDSIAADLSTFIYNYISSHKTMRWAWKGYAGTPDPIYMRWQPSTSTVSANVPFGHFIGATPDGRGSGEAVSEGISPFHGTDKNGPTAVIKSCAKLPNMLASGGQLHNIKFSPGIVTGEEGKQKLWQLIRAYLCDLKGMHIQFNVVSAETLRDCQKQPEKYPNLMVRVAGYSALFAELDSEIQEDIILRTEHALI
ncbi:MAG: glycyl radical protein [Nitrososphaeria archaeon]